MSFESLYVVNGVVVQREPPRTAQRPLHRRRAAGDDDHHRGRLRGVRPVPGRGGAGHHQVRRQRVLRLLSDDLRQQRLGGPHPFPNDKRTDKQLLTQEVTLGGPILKDKLWFFGAARLTGDRVTTGTTFATNLNFDDTRNQKRFEGKLTYALSSKHTFRGAYSKIKDTEDGNFFGNIMDFESLVNGRATPQDLLSANYTGIVTPKFFVEGQYSQRKFTFLNSGSLFTDLIKGTLLIDQSRNNARYNSPTFCGVCDPEKRDNQNMTAKATYFASTGKLGRAQPRGRLRPLRRQALRQQPPVRHRTTASSPRPRSSRGRRSSRSSTTGRSSAGRRSSSAPKGTASAPTPGSSTTPGASTGRDLQRRAALRQEQRRGQPGPRGGQGLRLQPAPLRDLRSRRRRLDRQRVLRALRGRHRQQHRRLRVRGRPGGHHRLHVPWPARQRRQPGQPRLHRAPRSTRCSTGSTRTAAPTARRAARPASRASTTASPTR